MVVSLTQRVINKVSFDDYNIIHKNILTVCPDLIWLSVRSLQLEFRLPGRKLNWHKWSALQSVRWHDVSGPLLPHLAPSWTLSLAENLASTSLQEGATKWLYNTAGTTIASVGNQEQDGVSHINNVCAVVRCPLLPVYVCSHIEY